MPGMVCCSPSFRAKEPSRFSYTKAHTDEVPDGRRRTRCQTSIFPTCDGTWLLALRDSRNNLVANLRSAQGLSGNQCSVGGYPVRKVSQPLLFAPERNNSPPGEKMVPVTLKLCSVKIARHVPSCGTRAPSRSCGPTSHATYRPPGEKDGASF